jgi:hypothetical protein
VAASLAVGGALLLAMLCASVRAGVTLDEDARIPIHCGSVEHCYLVSKRVGLVIWPVLGVVFFAVLGGVTASSLAAGWVPGVRDVIMPAVLAVVFGFQVGALMLAGRVTAGAAIPEGETGRGGKPPIVRDKKGF